MAKDQEPISAENCGRELRTREHCYQAAMRPSVVLTSRNAPMMVNGSMPNTLNFLLGKQRQKSDVLANCDKISYRFKMGLEINGKLSDLPQSDALAELRKRAAVVLREVQTLCR